MNENMDCYVIQQFDGGLDYGFFVEENGDWFYEKHGHSSFRSKQKLNNSQFILQPNEQYLSSSVIKSPVNARVDWEELVVTDANGNEYKLFPCLSSLDKR